MPGKTKTIPATPATNENEVPAMTTATPDAPAFDLSALANAVEESPDEIQRQRRTEPKYANNPFRDMVKKSKETGKTYQVPAVPVANVKDVIAYLRAAAKDAGHGLSVNAPTPLPESGTVAVRFQAKEARKNAGDKTECPVCHNEVSITSSQELRTHGPQKNRCSGSGRKVESIPASE